MHSAWCIDQCTVHCVQCASVHCILYWSEYSVHCTVYTVKYTMQFLLCTVAKTSSTTYAGMYDKQVVCNDAYSTFLQFIHYNAPCTTWRIAINLHRSSKEGPSKTSKVAWIKQSTATIHHKIYISEARYSHRMVWWNRATRQQIQKDITTKLLINLLFLFSFNLHHFKLHLIQDVLLVCQLKDSFIWVSSVKWTIIANLWLIWMLDEWDK